MALCNLQIAYHDQFYVLPVFSGMPLAEITVQVAAHFHLPNDSCELEIFDEVHQSYFDLDANYLATIFQTPSRVQNTMLMGRVILPRTDPVQDTAEESSDMDEDDYSNVTSELAGSPENQVNTADDDWVSLLVDDSSMITECNVVQDSRSLNQLIFVRDVAPYQNDGSSIKINDDHNENNQKISMCIRPLQGVRRDSLERYSNFSPEIKIPVHYVSQPGIKIAVAFVWQKLDDDRVTWYLHQFKRFLAKDANSNAESVNPIYIPLERNDLSLDGIFRLAVRICHISESSVSNQNSTPFHTLDVTTVYSLHSAQHEPNTPRLACMLTDTNGCTIWETFGLSDFIRPSSTIEEVQNLVSVCTPLSTDEKKESSTSIANLSHEKRFLDFPNPSLTCDIPELICIWMDATLHPLNDYTIYSIGELRRIINHVSVFNQVDKCLDFLNTKKNTQAIMIVSGSIGQRIVPLIHHFEHLLFIYIFCFNQEYHQQWAQQWKKIALVGTSLTAICSNLEKAVREYELSCFSFDVAPSQNTRLNEREKLIADRFIIMQTLLKILVEMNYDRQSFDEFVDLCRVHNNSDCITSNMIAEIDREYHHHSTIRWYTRATFLHKMVEAAFRTQDFCTIIKLGPFIKDLHRAIARLHQAQRENLSTPLLTFYRTTWLMKTQLDNLKNNVGGLILINGFTYASRNLETALMRVHDGCHSSELNRAVALFEIDSTDSFVPFADISGFSESDDECLFTLGYIFRIEFVEKIYEPFPHWRIVLKSSNELEETVVTFTQEIQSVISERFQKVGLPAENEAWYHMGTLLRKIGQESAAKMVYKVLLRKSLTVYEKSFLYNQIGAMSLQKGDFTEALLNHIKALETTFHLPLDDTAWLVTCYNGLGRISQELGGLNEALCFYINALHVQDQSEFIDKDDRITSWNNIACIRHDFGNFNDAIKYFEEALDFHQECTPDNHYSFAGIYNNMGLAYMNKYEYQQALRHYEKALDISIKHLPLNYPMQAISYNNIGMVYKNIHQYSEALLYYTRSMIIQQKYLPLDHLAFAPLYNNIGSLCMAINRYPTALLYFSKAAEIFRKILPSEHPSLATAYNNIGRVYHCQGKSFAARAFYEKALRLHGQLLSTNHLRLAIVYFNIGALHYDQDEPAEAEINLRKAFELVKDILPTHHPIIQGIFQYMTEYKLHQK